jgi:hypothetical protein
MIRDISREAGVRQAGCMQAIGANPASMHNDQSKMHVGFRMCYSGEKYCAAGNTRKDGCSALALVRNSDGGRTGSGWDAADSHGRQYAAWADGILRYRTVTFVHGIYVAAAGIHCDG